MVACLRCGEDNPHQARFCMYCATELPGPAAESHSVRKTVTVLFSDIVDSTRLGDRHDIELSNLVLSRFYDEARRVLERYQGRVEKFIGDAVMGVFGVPSLHEDDALRAVRAAVELRGALAAMNSELERDRNIRVSVRTAVNTGEVVVTDRPAGSSDPTVLGDAVNVASRLQHEAEPDEILLGDATYRLVREQVVVEQIPRRPLRGKRELVSVWRLRSLKPVTNRPTRRFAAPMVGRDHDLAAVRGFYERASSQRSCHLVTVLGEAGVGKTRLVEELERQIEHHAAVRHGWCRPYGEGITFEPIAQIIRRAAAIQEGSSASESKSRLAVLINDDRVVRQVAQLLGLRHGSAEPEDLQWALRRMLELLAAERPLVVVIEDLQHAPQPLLELIGYVADRSRNAPILLVCLARPELLDRHPSWGAMRNSMVLRLPPLNQSHAAELVGHLLGGGVLDPAVRASIADLGEGNPLFTEEWIADLTEAGTLRLVDDRWVVTGVPADAWTTPPRIDAIVTARLDRLTPEERAVVERAAVIGAPVRVAEVAALLTSATKPVVAMLMDLVRKELLTSDPVPASTAADSEEIFRFRHTIIRDAAYQAIPKEHRARLHEKYANWLENNEEHYPSQSVELIGRHLAHAHHYQTELGRHDATTSTLAQRAGRHLAAAGHRGLLRGDAWASVADLLSSAVQLLSENDATRLEALLELADALREAGMRERAIEAYGQALRAANAEEDEARAMRATLGRLEVAGDLDPEQTLIDGPSVVRRSLEVFEGLGDALNLANAWRLRAFVDAAVGRSTSAREAAERAVKLARSAGDDRFQARAMRLYCFILDWGPTPVREVAERTGQALKWARARGTRGLEKDALNILARTAAMQGNFGEARDLLDLVRSIKLESIKTDLSEPLYSQPSVADALTAASIALLRNQPRVAAGILLSRGGHAVVESSLERLDDVWPQPIVIAMLARAMLGLGRYQEAERLTRTCEEIAPSHQLDAQIKWRELRAVALAHQGELAEAERLARAAVALAERSEQAESRAQAFADLAEVLQVAGRAGEASAPLQRALDLYETKGNLVMAERTRALLLSAAAQ
jgi:class 3 adenylate cyclase/tetratricopeptide (TPR) repeat protein